MTSEDPLRLVMVAPHAIEERRLSHPDLDDAWRSFGDNDVVAVFHVAALFMFCSD